MNASSAIILLGPERRERIHSLLLAKFNEFSFKFFKMAKNIFGGGALITKFLQFIF
jgi:hypothetical protein